MAEARVVLVTGCSSGIGLDAARTLRARGWRVIATCRKPVDVERLRAEGLESLVLDLADAASIERAFAAAMEMTGGRLDALFNNGAYAIPGAVEDLPTDALRAIFETNFFGWHHLTRLAIPAMRARGGGRIVQCSSVLGLVGVRMRGAYVATKFALEGLTDALRLELRGTGIAVALIEPGPIRTAFRANCRPHYARWIDREASPWAAFYRGTLEPRLNSDASDPMELGPEAVTRALVHALESPRPKPRYYVTAGTWIMGIMRRLLPTPLLDRLAMMA